MFRSIGKQSGESTESVLKSFFQCFNVILTIFSLINEVSIFAR